MQTFFAYMRSSSEKINEFRPKQKRFDDKSCLTNRNELLFVCKTRSAKKLASFLANFSYTNVSVKLKLSGKDAKCPLKRSFLTNLEEIGRKKPNGIYLGLA